MKHLKIILKTLLVTQLFWAPVRAEAADLPPASSQPAVAEADQKKEKTATDSPKSDSTPESRAKGEAVLKKLTEFYKQLNSFSFELLTETLIKVDSPNTPDFKIKAGFDVTMKRPNKLSIVETSGTPILDELSDGKNLTVYSSENKKYIVLPAAANAQKLFREPAFRTGYGCLKCSLLDALLSESSEPWTSFSPVRANNELSYVSEETLDGTSVDKLRIVGPKFSEYIYVDRGAEPWLRRISSIDTNVADLPMPRNAPRMVSLTSTAQYNHPVANPSLEDKKFKFSPPAGVVKADTLAPEPPPNPLVGTAAADFSAELAEGKAVTLSKFRNKKVVILDFWATWCGPCRHAMPLVAKVADDYQKKGVLFFAVNEQEDKAKVLDFLKKNNLSMSVVLDHDGSIGGHYKVEAIPTTIIIDRKGTIRAVHTGFSNDIGTELSKELDLILAGKKKQTH